MAIDSPVLPVTLGITTALPSRLSAIAVASSKSCTPVINLTLAPV